jgi:hypothetical protein
MKEKRCRLSVCVGPGEVLVMAVIRVPCPKCGAVLKSSRPLEVGTKVLCRKCGDKFRVPAPSLSPEQAAREAFAFAGPALVDPAPSPANEAANEFQFTKPSVRGPAQPDTAAEVLILDTAAPAPAPKPAERVTTLPAGATVPALAVTPPAPLPPVGPAAARSFNPLALGLVIAGSLLFVGLGVTLVVWCLNSSSPAAAGNEETSGSPVMLGPDNTGKPIPAKNPPVENLVATTRPPTATNTPPIEKPAAKQPPESKQPPRVEPPTAPQKQVVAKPKAPPVVEKQPEPVKPPEPEPIVVPVVEESQLAGAKRLGPYLVTVRKPKALTTAVKRGLKWLASKQHADGGWGEGGVGQMRFGGRAARFRRPNRGGADTSNVPDTCIATLALLRAGSSPAEGPHAKNLLKSVLYVCKQVENADEESLGLVKDMPAQPNGRMGFGNRGNTLVQVKIGTHVDTYLATLLLAEVNGRLPDADTEQRVAAALKKLVSKMEKNQQEDGSWAPKGYNAWAPVLGQGLGTKAINRARQAGVPVADAILERARKGAEKAFDSRTGQVVVDGRAAGVALYSASANLAALQDLVNTYRAQEKQVRQTASAGPTPMIRQSALTKLDKIKDTQKSNLQATKVVAKNLSNKRFVAGFGNNGGEEFLSYLNISEALAVRSGSDWTAWDKNMQRNLSHVQNKDGSWSGHHCITGQTFCTASALLVLMADRSPVPVAVKVKQ